MLAGVLIHQSQNGAKLESRQSVAIMGVLLSSCLYCELQWGLINVWGFCPRWCHSTKMKWDTMPECHLQEFQRLINLSSKGSKLSPFFRCSFIILDSSGAFIIYRAQNSTKISRVQRAPAKVLSFVAFFFFFFNKTDALLCLAFVRDGQFIPGRWIRKGREITQF